MMDCIVFVYFVVLKILSIRFFCAVVLFSEVNWAKLHLVAARTSIMSDAISRCVCRGSCWRLAPSVLVL